MKVTLHDIAKAAKVSISTVSRALSSDPAISDENAERVRKIATRLKYRGPRKRTRSTGGGLAGKTIGVISLGMDRSLVSLPVVAAAINGAEEALSDVGARVLLVHVPVLERIPASLHDTPLDGAILSGALHGEFIASQSSPFLDRLRHTPCVWILGKPRHCWGDAVVGADYTIGTRTAELLAERGHRRVAFLNPKPDHATFCRREEALIGAAARLGIEVIRLCEEPAQGWAYPLRPPETIDSIQHLMERFLATSPRPTAIVAAADSVAALVCRSLTAAGLRVGEDVSVVSANNDRPLIAGLHPSLTTFDVHSNLMGQWAVRLLHDRLADPSSRPPVEIAVEPTLVAGASLADLTK